MPDEVVEALRTELEMSKLCELVEVAQLPSKGAPVMPIVARSVMRLEPMLVKAVGPDLMRKVLCIAIAPLA